VLRLRRVEVGDWIIIEVTVSHRDDSSFRFTFRLGWRHFRLFYSARSVLGPLCKAMDTIMKV
jgi:hypothetical protein